MRQTTIFDDTVANRIEALLTRCDQLRRGTAITRPTRFNAAGERHATAIAHNDQRVSRVGEDLESREVGVSLQRQVATQITSSQNAMPTLPDCTASR